MTTLLHTREQKLKAIALYEEIAKTFLFHGMKPADIAGVLTHRDWMRRQSGDLRANCKLETFPAIRSTRITLELSFVEELPPFTAPKP